MMKMTNLSSFRVILLTIIVLIDTKVLASADKTDQNNPAAKSSSATHNLLASDNICNNNEKNVAFDVVLIENFTQGRSKRETPTNQKRPRADQKSLLIIFDGTGSMHDDLQQLRSGAQEIINDLSSRNDSPIFNYVLVVYRDPSECANCYRLINKNEAYNKCGKQVQIKWEIFFVLLKI